MGGGWGGVCVWVGVWGVWSQILSQPRAVPQLDRPDIDSTVRTKAHKGLRHNPPARDPNRHGTTTATATKRARSASRTFRLIRAFA